MINSIQYLRGIAALSVALFHLYPIFFNQTPNPLASGAAGVDIFFVISGFIMWHVAQSKEPTPFDFLSHRLVRVVPLYWTITLVLAISATLKPNLFPLDNPSLIHIFKSMLFVPHGASPEGRPLVSQGWTLNYEMLFYAFFSIALCLPRNSRSAALYSTFLTFAILGIAFKSNSYFFNWVTNSIILEFIFGIGVAQAYQNKRLVPRLPAYLFIGCSLSVIYLSDGAYPRVVVFGLPSAIIVWSMLSIERIGNLKPQRILLELGSISYSLYLVHFMAGNFYLISAAHIGLPITGGLGYILAVLTAIFAAGICHYVLERPLLNFFRNLIAKHSPTKH